MCIKFRLYTKSFCLLFYIKKLKSFSFILKSSDDAFDLIKCCAVLHFKWMLEMKLNSLKAIFLDIKSHTSSCTNICLLYWGGEDCYFGFLSQRFSFFSLALFCMISSNNISRSTPYTMSLSFDVSDSCNDLPIFRCRKVDHISLVEVSIFSCISRFEISFWY